MLILLIDNENMCTDTNFIDLKNVVSFLDISKSLLLGNVLILCIFFWKIPEKSLAHLKKKLQNKNRLFFKIWLFLVQ